MGGVIIADMTGMIMDGLAGTFLIVGVLSVYASRSEGLHEASPDDDCGLGIVCLLALIVLAFAPSAWNAMKGGLRSSHYVPQN